MATTIAACHSSKPPIWLKNSAPQKNVLFEEPIRDFKNPGREAEMPSDVTM